MIFSFNKLKQICESLLIQVHRIKTMKGKHFHKHNHKKQKYRIHISIK